MTIKYAEEVKYLLDNGIISEEQANLAALAVPPKMVAELTTWVHTVLCLHEEGCMFHTEKYWSDPCKAEWLRVTIGIIDYLKIEQEVSADYLRHLMVRVTKIGAENPECIPILISCLKAEEERQKRHAYLPLEKE